MKQITRREAYTPCKLHLREGEDGSGRTIEGYAIIFDTPSEPMWADEKCEIREVISREAITKELLDVCDIKMTMFHDRQLILARSRNGAGTLSYEVDEKGVKFSFEAPATVDGDKAIELVKRGDISGCSFAFITNYTDRKCVEKHSETRDGKKYITYTVRQVDSVHDFTLAADPAYGDASVSAREMGAALHAKVEKNEGNEGNEVNGGAGVRAQIREMRNRITKL